MRARSSAGRAPAWHAGGRRFDPDRVHHSFHYPETIHAGRAEMRAVGAYFATGLTRQSAETLDSRTETAFSLQTAKTRLAPFARVRIYSRRELSDFEGFTDHFTDKGVRSFIALGDFTDSHSIKVFISPDEPPDQITQLVGG